MYDTFHTVISRLIAFGSVIRQLDRLNKAPAANWWEAPSCWEARGPGPTGPPLDPALVVNKLHAWQVGSRQFEPRSGIQVSKRQFFSSLLIRKLYLILGGASVTENKILCLEGSLISFVSPSSGDFSSRPSLAYICNYIYVHKSDLSPIHSFIFGAII